MFTEPFTFFNVYFVSIIFNFITPCYNSKFIGCETDLPNPSFKKVAYMKQKNLLYYTELFCKYTVNFVLHFI